MRQNVLILAVFIVLLGDCATMSWAGDPVDTAALGQVLDQWAVAWSSSDVDKLLPLFTDDVFYEDVTFGAVNQGKDALRTFATDSFGAFPGMSFEVKSRLVASDGKW
jgi:ketosteroid isomerase-like protein